MNCLVEADNCCGIENAASFNNKARYVREFYFSPILTY